MSINLELNEVKSILSSNRVVYDFLKEKKGYYLDRFSHKAINYNYLQKLLIGELWAPKILKSEDW